MRVCVAAGRSSATAALTWCGRAWPWSLRLRAQGGRDIVDAQKLRLQRELAPRCECANDELAHAARVEMRVDARPGKRSERPMDETRTDDRLERVAQDLLDRGGVRQRDVLHQICA